mmetsp:Transcript_17573/g.30990  ORF Transcript_17573/g.30990 Transcript_17573/m.30990 type:complete len:734 (+) Transcript_17573:515-2716(+)
MFFFFVVVIASRVMVRGLLLRKEVGLGEEQHRNRNTSNSQQQVLNASLSIVHGLVHISWSQRNIDQTRNEVRRLAAIARPPKVKGTLVNRIIIALTDISPGGAGSIPTTVAIDPHASLAIHSLLIVGAAPSVRGGVEAGGAQHPGVPVDGPLHENQNDHVNKERARKCHHGQKLKEKVETLAKVHGIDALEARSRKHLKNAKDNRELHLERVEEEQLVLRHVPNGIETKGVDGIAVAIFSIQFGDVALFRLIAAEGVTRSKQVEAEGETIVIDQSSVHSEESHHDNHVPSHMHSPHHLVELGLLVLLLVPKQPEACTEEEQSVSNVTVHDTKQERKGCSGEQRRIGFSVPRNTVRVDKLLITISELVRGKVRGKSRPRLGHLIHMTRHILIHVTMRTIHTRPHILKRFGNDPPLPTEHTRHIRLEHVEGVVDGLFPEDDPRPAFRVLGEHLAEAEARVLVLEEDGAGVDEFLGVLGEHAIDGRGIIHIRQRVAMRKKGITNLLELGLNTERLEKHDKHALLNETSRLRISNGLLNGRKPHITIPPRGTKDHALEPHLLLRANNTRDGAEAHIEVGPRLVIVRPGQQRTRLGGRSARGKLGHGETRSIRHEEPTSLLEDLLQLHLLVVFPRELFGIGIEFLELRFVPFQFHLEGFQELGARGSLAPRGGGSAGRTERGSRPADDGGVALEETVNVPRGLEVQSKVIALVAEKAEFALQLVAAPDVADVTALEGG